MIDFRSPPNESRGFVHKRLLRGAIGLVTGGPTAAAGGFLSGGGSRARRTPMALAPVATAFNPLANRPEISRFAGRQSIAAPCRRPWRRDPVSGQCALFLGDRPGRDTAPLETGPGVPVGDATMGRYGAALVPGSRIVDRATCLRGMVLGNDGLCYNSKGFRNADRMWPRGRRPLLTGGEMRAISVASRAAGRLTRTAQRLQDIGLIQKPIVRRRPKKK